MAAHFTRSEPIRELEKTRARAGRQIGLGHRSSAPSCHADRADWPRFGLTSLTSLWLSRETGRISVAHAGSAATRAAVRYGLVEQNGKLYLQIDISNDGQRGIPADVVDSQYVAFQQIEIISRHRFALL